ncbi:hypothetical protein ACPOL_6544 [Acidisarcina polymorpha]|uniref:Uncharacterized protein n=1 Tax=Acidisarcina polymorpha TaxID=2211140 RepID=A0A2Z5GAM3_9BACT|nr:hypothetical protein ACPOL_6544 [Acidisarcina polymorpha]
MPKLRSLPFKTAIIERYRRAAPRREHHPGLVGPRVSASTVGDLNQCSNVPKEQTFPAIWVDNDKAWHHSHTRSQRLSST